MGGDTRPPGDGWWPGDGVASSDVGARRRGKDGRPARGAVSCQKNIGELCYCMLTDVHRTHPDPMQIKLSQFQIALPWMRVQNEEALALS